MTVAVDDDEVREKSCPVPVRVSVNGPVGLVLIVKTPLREPPCVGSKNTPIEQLDPEATVLPHVLSEPKSAVVVETFEIVMEEPLLLVSVTVWGRPEVPTY